MSLQRRINISVLNKYEENFFLSRPRYPGNTAAHVYSQAPGGAELCYSDQCELHTVTTGHTVPLLMCHTTPVLERRHRTLPHGGQAQGRLQGDFQGFDQGKPQYREYDVSSMMSEIEQLSLYSGSSRKHSLVGGLDTDHESSHRSRRQRHRSGRSHDPKPVITKSEPPSPGHSYDIGHGDIGHSPGHSYCSETRDNWQLDDPTPGCCSLQHSSG